jgi:hypothetical protein
VNICADLKLPVVGRAKAVIMVHGGIRKNAVLRTYVRVLKRGCKLIDLSTLRLPMGAVDISAEVFGLVPNWTSAGRWPWAMAGLQHRL